MAHMRLALKVCVGITVRQVTESARVRTAGCANPTSGKKSAKTVTPLTACAYTPNVLPP